MGEESVVFEIQVDRSLLEKLLVQNENLSYEKFLQMEEREKQLKEELRVLRQNLKESEHINRDITVENGRLSAWIRDLEVFKHIYEERHGSESMEATENKLLRMKMRKLEQEKKTLTADFEKQQMFFEALVHDNFRLKKAEDDVRELRTKLAVARWNLANARQNIRRLKEENQKLDWAKLDAETALVDMTRKMRLMEERSNLDSLEVVESKMLKLKLCNIEKENSYLQADFERERKILSNLNKPRVARIEENLKALRHWIEKEAVKRTPFHESEEMKTLREKISTLEEEKGSLNEAIEMERRVFSRILRDQSMSSVLS